MRIPLDDRGVGELFEQGGPMRLPAQLARRLAAVDVQIASERVGEGPESRARVVEREVSDAPVAARGARRRARDLQIRDRRAAGRIVDAARNALIDDRT